ncbi:sigma-54-dependent Fis family transcriptional regulator [Thauera linaloolentis]|uniref:Sigma-54 dependent transcriptional regulator n=1 Tax=Thauera linaloolentis (strain DSM 12138 / JCM 21573 / CCUG 41526 / CIP 105981 / IAM 15112 / NBRC 102519 / 47Lol) TaxID=1123367 RepID=N6Z1C4_THAL4|nr:sigma-54-dependent Fis family transcriptional regulator [Thauera linaloolentis]ENO85964.1 sigma-54 dependent transcriptional regulator [Thauera linaloolentis 47Lol = DSM 12138]MCM8567194.1 sigma-54-dependent Fis family transcriptional regulator [Thauera linaloolentis]
MGQLLPAGGRELRVTEARRRFFEEGACPDGVLPTEVLRSWLRCRDAGVDYQANGRGDPEGRSGLADARERSELLLNNASGVMEHVFEQIRSSGSMVILADSQGMILHSLGDPDFVGRAQRVALQPGALWNEDMRGTNAIGTALVEAAPVEVIGAEHFLDRNGILTCSAAPVFGPEGGVAGVLDISGDSRSNQRHTLGLVRLAAQLLEKRLFEIQHAREILVAIHTRPECIGGLQEGLLAVAQDGQVVGANGIARALLKQLPVSLEGLDFSAVFRLSFGAFMDRCARDPHALQALDLRAGERIFSRLRAAGPLVGMSRAGARADAGESAARTQPGQPAKRCNRHSGEITLDCLATGDPRLQLALDRAARITGKDIPLLIQGESGVGKELFARAFHFSGPRSDGPFVALNCAAIPESLIESELFGYVGGAFTGARREGAIGKIQQAHGGTLFLDEIGDMPLGMQARLLRVLQERCVTPIGGQRQIPVDISLVCATHRMLRDAVKAGIFREDLYYRVNGLTVTVPPLRERSDIRSIVAKILEVELGDTPRAGQVRISEQVLDFVENYPWPGNVRQLQNVIRVAAALLDDDETEILPVHLPEELFGADPMDDAESGRQQAAVPAGGAEAAAAALASPSMPARSLDEIELEAIAAVMREVSGNVSAAARRLGISRNTLYRKIGRMH